jgi:GntR family transcriptional regulator/MocR family aminotransferase
MPAALPPAMPEILPVVTLDRQSRVPLYRQIYRGYRDAIAERRLRPGERLPSTRSLAAELGVSRLPVLAAFDQLLAEGYCESRLGAGTFVAEALGPEGAVAAGAPPPRPGRRRTSRASARFAAPRDEPWLAGTGAFRTSQVDLTGFPFAAWARLVARHARNPRSSLLAYGDAMGYMPFREQLATYLRTARGVRCEAEQILVVSGSQQALQIAARVLLDPGDQVWVEEPGYDGARDALTLAGAKLAPVPVDADGMDVARGMARAPRARLAHVTPSHQYPLGATLSAARRLQLLDWARASGAWVLEDDYDSEFRYSSQPISSLQGLDRDARVLYVGTLSKILFPALRLGYIVVPPDLVRRFAGVRTTLDIFPSTLQQAALADFIAEGHFARHVRRMREIYRGRCTLLVECLRRELGDGIELRGEHAGLHLVATLPRGTDDRAISRRAAESRLWAMPLSSCYLGRPAMAGLVLGFGGTTRSQIRDGARRLREVLG